MTLKYFEMGGGVVKAKSKGMRDNDLDPAKNNEFRHSYHYQSVGVELYAYPGWHTLNTGSHYQSVGWEL